MQISHSLFQAYFYVSLIFYFRIQLRCWNTVPNSLVLLKLVHEPTLTIRIHPFYAVSQRIASLQNSGWHFIYLTLLNETIFCDFRLVHWVRVWRSTTYKRREWLTWKYFRFLSPYFKDMLSVKGVRLSPQEQLI